MRCLAIIPARAVARLERVIVSTDGTEIAAVAESAMRRTSSMLKQERGFRT